MRLTVNLKQEAYDFVTVYANAKGITLSAAINELIHRAEQAPEPSSGRLRMNEYGYYEIVGTGDPREIVTPEMVKKYSEDPLVGQSACLNARR